MSISPKLKAPLLVALLLSLFYTGLFMWTKYSEVSPVPQPMLENEDSQEDSYLDDLPNIDISVPDLFDSYNTIYIVDISDNWYYYYYPENSTVVGSTERLLL